MCDQISSVMYCTALCICEHNMWWGSNAKTPSYKCENFHPSHYTNLLFPLVSLPSIYVAISSNLYRNITTHNQRTRFSSTNDPWSTFHANYWKLIAPTMRRCPPCRVDKTVADFDVAPGGALRLTCRLCLVSPMVSFYTLPSIEISFSYNWIHRKIYKLKEEHE